MTKGQRIKDLRKEAGLSQVDLASKIAVSKQTLYKYENDIVSNIPYDKVEKLASVLDTTPSYIMGWEEGYPINNMTLISDVLKIAEIENKTLSEILGFDVQPEDYEGKGNMRVHEVHLLSNIRNGLKKERSLDPIYNVFANIRPIRKQRLPVLGSVAAGEPILMNGEKEVYVESEVKADFLLVVKGNSMIGARIHDGDLVFVRQQPTVENGEIAVVAIDDEATLKRFYRYGDDLIVLRAENPAYADMEFRPKDGKEIHVLGKAVAFQSDIK